jgi:hypothetical protein
VLSFVSLKGQTGYFKIFFVVSVISSYLKGGFCIYPFIFFTIHMKISIFFSLQFVFVFIFCILLHVMLLSVFMQLIFFPATLFSS